MEIQQTKSINSLTPRSDLIQSDFDNLVFQKGRPVLFEQALQCPCKSPSTNQQSTCKNCGGSGWIFVNGVETRMLIQAITVNNNDIKAWSEESRGTVNITSRSFENLTYMDRLSLLDSQAIYNEVVFLTASTSDTSSYFSFTTYNILKILYIGIFKGVNEPLIKLNNTDFVIQNNIIRVKKEVIDVLSIEEEHLSLTIKYIHPPTFYVFDVKRETMESMKLSGYGEQNQRFPVSAIGRRTHYMLDAENLSKNRIINNDYLETKDCTIPNQCNV